ncbi:DUF945 family protein [Thalassotalea ponticola]|uniref:DUF945 family protein n=1 Tax=Thalassotalea ponticola TaxID=1523392 RepID=UPI0025B42B2B|nr:DUF945 family protein [Thalassotalea ponticola]MDN3652964.1 DUF945 family protein [Thalassotalea ponticola]
MKMRYVSLALGAGLLASPYFAGKQIERDFTHIIAQISAQTPYDVSIDHYQRGWFSSTADVSIQVEQLVDDMVEPLVLTFKATHDIQHGPLLSQSSLTLGLADIRHHITLEHNMPDSDQLNHDFSNDKVDYYTQITFLGDSYSTLSSKTITVNSSDAVMKILPTDLTIKLTHQGELALNGIWQGMTVYQHEQALVEIGQMQMTSNQQIVRGSVWANTAIMVGDSNIHLDSLLIQDNDDVGPIAMNHVDITTTSADHNGLMAGKAVVSAKDIRALGLTFDGFNYQSSIKNVDLDTYAELQALLVKASMQDNPQQFAQQVQVIIPKLLKSAPEFKMDNLALTTGQGDISSYMDISFDSDKIDTSNPMSIYTAIDANAHGQAPLDFFVELNMSEVIDDLLAEKILIREQQNIRFDFSLADGLPILNGQAVPLG